MLAGLVWFVSSYELRTHSMSLGIVFVVTICVAILMVSNVRFYSFKDLDLRGRVPFVTVLAIVVGFVLISLEPSIVLLLIVALQDA